jgi:rubredoxin
MTLLELQAALARRQGCTLRIGINSMERDGLGRAAGAGSACVDCGVCKHEHGELGTLVTGIRVVGAWDRLRLEWSCPECGGTTVEGTDALRCFAAARKIAADARRCRCRSRTRDGVVERWAAHMLVT